MSLETPNLQAWGRLWAVRQWPTPTGDDSG